MGRKDGGEQAQEGGVFARMGCGPCARRFLFWCVCIWVRAAAGALVVYFAENPNAEDFDTSGEDIDDYIGIAAICLGSVVVLRNCCGLRSGGPVWWYRSLHGLTGALLIFLGILQLITRNFQTSVIGWLLIADVGAGVLTALCKRPFRAPPKVEEQQQGGDGAVAQTGTAV